MHSQESRLKLLFLVRVSVKPHAVRQPSSLPLCQHLPALIAPGWLIPSRFSLWAETARARHVLGTQQLTCTGCVVCVYCVEVYQLLIKKKSHLVAEKTSEAGCLKCWFKRPCFSFRCHLLPPERSTSEPSSSIIPPHFLTEEAPESTHDHVEHVDSGVPHFPYQKSWFLVATHPSNSNFPSLCQNILAFISAFIKKITSQAFLLPLFI